MSISKSIQGYSTRVYTHKRVTSDDMSHDVMQINFFAILLGIVYGD